VRRVAAPVGARLASPRTAFGKHSHGEQHYNDPDGALAPVSGQLGSSDLEVISGSPILIRVPA
jgi:hypothetical protein